MSLRRAVGKADRGLKAAGGELLRAELEVLNIEALHPDVEGLAAGGVSLKGLVVFALRLVRGGDNRLQILLLARPILLVSLVWPLDAGVRCV